MPQTKQAKRQKVLNNLLARLQDIQAQRESLQVQSYYLITPSHDEFRITQEVNALKRKMGILPALTECPF